jgi:hypothetical protein
MKFGTKKIYLAALILCSCLPKYEKEKPLLKLPAAEQYLDNTQVAVDLNQLDSAKMWLGKADSAYNVKPYALIELQKKINEMEDTLNNRSLDTMQAAP